MSTTMIHTKTDPQSTPDPNQDVAAFLATADMASRDQLVGLCGWAASEVRELRRELGDPAAEAMDPTALLAELREADRDALRERARLLEGELLDLREIRKPAENLDTTVAPDIAEPGA